MEESQENAPVEQPKESSGSEGKESKDFVKYESFQKLLGEKKGLQEKYHQTTEKMKELEEKLMEKDQDVQKQANYWKEKYEQTSKKLDDTQKSYTWTTLTSQVKSKAQELGCTNPDKLVRLMDDEDLRALSEEIGEDFKLNNDVLNGVLEKNKKENFFLFKDVAPKVANGMPKSKPEDKKFDPKKMSNEELKEAFKKAYKS
jgi:hypothetical protein